jgi:hypothetical protein
MRSSSTVPHITALLRTCCASLRLSYRVLVMPINSHDVIKRRIFRPRECFSDPIGLQRNNGLLLVSGVCGY